MITRVIFNTDVHCNDLHANNFIGDGSQLTNLPNSNPYTGTANHVVITNGSGALTDAAYLDPVYGGLGVDASAFQGVVKGDGSGNFSAAQIDNNDVANNANLDRSKLAAGTANRIVMNDNAGALTEAANLAPSYGGLGTDASAFQGVVKADGSGNFSAAQINNNDVASNANLDRSKIAAGTANYILVNDGSGNMSEVQYLNRDKIAVDNSNQYKFLYNDNTGAIVANAALKINNNDLEMNPDSNIVLKKDCFMDADKKFLLQKVLNVQTSNDTATAIYSLTCDNNKSYLVKFELLLVDASANSGIINGYCKVKHGNASTQPTASYIISNGSILDAALANCEVQLDTNTNDVFKLMVVGLAGTTINWYAKCDYIKN